MVNPWSGEVALTIDGTQHVLRLTLGALASLEAELETGTLVELIARFEEGAFSTRDLVALLLAGLQGGGARLTAADLMDAEIAGGPREATRVAALLLARAFALPDADDAAV